MWTILALIFTFVLLDLASLWWGVDSRVSSQDPTWGRPERAGPSLIAVTVRTDGENRH